MIPWLCTGVAIGACAMHMVHACLQLWMDQWDQWEQQERDAAERMPPVRKDRKRGAK